jgi:hypothetical protein
MKHCIELFESTTDGYGGSILPSKVNSWLEENADKIEVQKIEHQQTIFNNRVHITILVHYLKK